MSISLMNKSICFVCGEALPVIAPEFGDFRHGGEGVQQTLLAKAFAQRGFDVHMVTLDRGQPAGKQVHGVTLWPTYNPNAGIPILRFFYPRMTALFSALHRANCQVYYQSCAGVETGWVALYTRIFGKKFIYRIASDLACVERKQLLLSVRDRQIYVYGLKSADLIIAQTESQRDLLRKNYSLDSVTADMLVEQPQDILPFSMRNIDVLWVANLRPPKRPELLLDIAAALPDVNFTVVGGAASSYTAEQYECIRNRAMALPNISWLGWRSYAETQPLFSRAKVLLSTSSYEGFPNTYLQAWIAGTPVLAFFDPDGILEQQALGLCVHSTDEAIQATRMMVTDSAVWQGASNRSRAYCIARHGNDVVDQYEGLIDQVLNTNGS